MTEITSVVLGTVTLSCELVDRPRSKRNISIEIPGRSTPLLQIVSGLSNTITLRGRLYGSSKETDSATLKGYASSLASVSYVDTDNGTLTVSVESVEIPDDANTHTTFRDYTITLRVMA